MLHTTAAHSPSVKTDAHVNGSSGSDDTLAALILRHLPSLGTSQELDSHILDSIRRASRAPSMHSTIMTVLPRLTAVALQVRTSVLPGVANTITIILSSFVLRRQHRLASAYLVELVLLCVEFLEYRGNAPFTFKLSSFPTENALEVSVSQKSVQSLLYVLLTNVPSVYTPAPHPTAMLDSNTDSSNAQSDAEPKSHNPSPTDSAVQPLRIWFSISERSRVAVLHLASRHELLSGRFGSTPATLAAHVLARALDPSAATYPPLPLIEHIAAVAEDCLFESPVPLILLRVIRFSQHDFRIPAGVWNKWLPTHALGNDEFARSLRSLAKRGAVDWSTYDCTAAVDVEHRVERPTKRQRLQDSSEAVVQISSQNDAPTPSQTLDDTSGSASWLGAISSLQSSLRVLPDVDVCATSAEALTLLARATELTASALFSTFGQYPHPARECEGKAWFQFADPLSRILRDVTGAVKAEPPESVLHALLRVAQSSLRLFCAVRDTRRSEEQSFEPLTAAFAAALSSVVPPLMARKDRSGEIHRSLIDLLFQAGNVALDISAPVSQSAELAESMRRVQAAAVESISQSVGTEQPSHDDARFLNAAYHAARATCSPSGANCAEKARVICQMAAGCLEKEQHTAASWCLSALADFICISACCYEDHCPDFNVGKRGVAIRPRSCKELDGIDWQSVRHVLAMATKVAKTSDQEQLVLSLVRCIFSTILHTRYEEGQQCENLLLDALWASSCSAFLSRTGGFVSNVSSIAESVTGYHNISRGISSRGLLANVGQNGENPSLSSDLACDIKKRLESLESSVLSRTVAEITGNLSILNNKNLTPEGLDALQLSPIGLSFVFCEQKTASSGLLGRICDNILVGSSAELRLCSVPPSEPTDDPAHESQIVSGRSFFLWNVLLTLALCGTSCRERSQETPIFAKTRESSYMRRRRVSFGLQSSVTQAVSTFLSLRQKEWLPHSSQRLVSDTSFFSHVSLVLMDSEKSSIWNKVSKQVVVLFVRNQNVDMLQRLAEKQMLSQSSLLGTAISDVLATVAMEGVADLGTDSFLSKIMPRPIECVVRERVGKIVQRLVMEFGGHEEEKARDALVFFSGVVHGPSKPSTIERDNRDAVIGSLLSSHFILVMDAVNRQIFQPKGSEAERLRGLDILKSLVSLQVRELHRFVPKILATLKVSLDIFSHNETACEAVLRAWSAFLQSHGCEVIIDDHVVSVLAILLPFFERYRHIIGETLNVFVEESVPKLRMSKREVGFLLRLFNQPTFRKPIEVVENQHTVRGSSKVAEVPASSETSLTLSIQELAALGKSFGSLVAQPGNSVTQLTAAQYLLRVLQHNREALNNGANSQAHGSNQESSNYLEALSALLCTLVGQLGKVIDSDTRNVIMVCIGELGALDPRVVSRYINTSACNGDDSARNKLEFPESVYGLVALILEEHLVPRFKQVTCQTTDQRNGAKNMNRISLAFQLLLRVCGCRRDTAARASKTSRNNDEPRRYWAAWPTLPRCGNVKNHAVSFWEELTAGTTEVLEPFLVENFDAQKYDDFFGKNLAGDIENACQPVWSRVKVSADAMYADTQQWRRQMVVQMVDFIGKTGTFGETLRALRPVLRYDDTISALVFPLVVMGALDHQSQERDSAVQDFLVTEMSQVLKEASSPYPLFELFETLREWRERRCQLRAQTMSPSSSGSTNGTRRKVSNAVLHELAKSQDPLTSLIDLEGQEAASLSLLLQSKSAFKARSFPRAILLAESHIRNVRNQNNIGGWPSFIESIVGKVDTTEENEEAQACGILQKSFAELEDAESMAGIAALRSSSSLAEIVVDTEVSGQYNEALVSYERALAEDARGIDFHRGFLRCLMTLGHWETMLSHAEGLFTSCKLEEVELQRIAEANGVDAAWRLGRWDDLQNLQWPESDTCREPQTQDSGTSWSLDCGLCIGKMLLCLKQGNIPGLRIAANDARQHLATPMIRAAREGYARVYPMIVLLHSMADIEDVADKLSIASTEGSRGNDNERQVNPNLMRLISLSSRSQRTAPSLRTREPLISTRRVCFEVLGMPTHAAKVSLELAQMARESENFRLAAASAFRASQVDDVDEEIRHASVLETALIQRAQVDASKALGIVKKEIERHHKILKDQNENGASSSSMEATSSRLCTALVLAGTWIEESRSESSEVILKYYEEAASHGPNREEPFYALGKHYDSLLQASQKAGGDPLGEGSPLETKAAQRGSSITKHDPQHFSQFVPLIIRSFARSLRNGHTRLFEALPRMLTVWFDYNAGLQDRDIGWKGAKVEESVKSEIETAFEAIPMYMWLTVIPQLMSHILHSRSTVREKLSNLLSRIVGEFPDHSFWSILPSTQFASEDRRRVCSAIINNSVNLVRRLHVRDARERSKTLRMRLQSAMGIIGRIIEICENSGSKEKKGQQENCSLEFQSLRRLLRPTGVPTPMIPTLQTLTVRLPAEGASEHAPLDPDPVRVEGIADMVLVMSSLMRPRRISLLGSDGHLYKYLTKKENQGDMRKDSRVVEFLTVMNRMLSKDSKTSGKGLELLTYAVLPLTEELGMIQWVDNLTPFRSLVGEEHARIKSLPTIPAINRQYDSTPDKKKFLTEWAFKKFPPVFDRFFVKRFGSGDAQAWLAARNEWTKSCAVWSMSGYVVGLGDRHGENVLVETTTGRCVHVDFAMLFDKGAKLRVPEVVPFRLTRNMVCAMGITGYEGMYRMVCETVLSIVRRNADALLNMLETFLYDPLADWCGNQTKGVKAGVVATREAWVTQAALKAKMSGLVDKSGLALSIAGQVDRLIRVSSSAENLSKMYIWWSAWI